MDGRGLDMRAVVAGGSGFIGQHLAAELEHQGYDVVILSRKVDPKAKFREVQWDAKTQGAWEREIDGAHAVFNLSGASIEKKWTPDYKKVIIDSRIDSTRAIHQAIRLVPNKPKAWVNSSAVGWYGDRGDQILSESTRAGDGFLHEVCEEWEKACFDPDIPEVKQVCLRTGIVLGQDGGIFPEMSKLAKLGLGGAAGGGNQWLPVIHIEDMARMYVWAVESAQEGPINACCPNPVTNNEFMGALRSAYSRPWSPPVPPFALKMGAGLIGKEGALILMSQRAVPTLALSQGFKFHYSTLDSMIRNLTE